MKQGSVAEQDASLTSEPTGLEPVGLRLCNQTAVTTALLGSERNCGVVGDLLSFNPQGQNRLRTLEGIVCQKNRHLVHMVGRGMRMSAFPIQDSGFIAADDFRHILLQQSQIQSTLANCIA